MPAATAYTPEGLASPPGDGGPVYRETDLGAAVAEPWNAASALAFLLLAAFWAVRLRGRYRRYPFLCACLAVLAAGGVGGVLYHASRTSYAFFLLDVVPISVLVLAASLYVWARLLPRRGFLLAVLPLYAGAGLVPRAEPNHRAINLTYALLAGLILLPTALLLLRTRFRDGGWVGLALACFGAALFFRHADLAYALPGLPMGTHWLWHLFGAAATGALAEYLYRLEGRPLSG